MSLGRMSAVVWAEEGEVWEEKKPHLTSKCQNKSVPASAAFNKPVHITGKLADW